MGFLDSLGNTVKKLGKAAIAGPGAVWDIASYVVPGDQWGKCRRQRLRRAAELPRSPRHRHRSLAVPQPIKSGLGGVMAGLNTVYHKGVDQPISTFMTEMQHASNQDTLGARLGSLVSSEDWAHAYDIADKQTFGQSSVFGSPTARRTRSSSRQDPVRATVAKDHPFLANASAFGIDMGVSWFLDPAVVAGKVAGTYRQAHVLGTHPRRREARVRCPSRRLDQGCRQDLGKAQNWDGRFNDFFNYIGGENKLNRPLNAAEIRASSVELQKSSGGLAISSALRTP
jgi:hypothetical protein